MDALYRVINICISHYSADLHRKCYESSWLGVGDKFNKDKKKEKKRKKVVY